MGLGKFILIVIVIIIAVYLISPTIFQSGYSQVQNIFKQWNITLPMIPSYNGTILNNQTNIDINITSNLSEASSVGQVYIYLATTPDSGMTQVELDRFIISFKNYLYQASYGYLNNINFITELNANSTNPNINKSLIGTKIKGTHYLTANFDSTSMVYWRDNYNANIKWTFSAAIWHSRFPWSFTTYNGRLTPDGCAQLFLGGSSGDVCRETAHELAHAIFACDDDTGDIMRCTNEYPCTYPGHFPPVCLNLMKDYMPQLVAK